MITRDDLPILRKLLSFPTREAQEAFLEGLQFQLNPQQAMPTPMVPMAPLATPESPRPRVSKPPGSYFPHRGLQGIILRLLWTGPATFSELNSQAQVYPSVLQTCIRRLVTRNYIAIDRSQPPLHTLTSDGRKLAKWYVDHPGAKIMPSLASLGLSHESKKGQS